MKIQGVFPNVNNKVRQLHSLLEPRRIRNFWFCWQGHLLLRHTGFRRHHPSALLPAGQLSQYRSHPAFRLRFGKIVLVAQDSVLLLAHAAPLRKRKGLLFYSTLSMSSSDIESKEEECGTKGTNDPSPCKKVESSARLSVAALLDAAELAFTNETGLRRLANLSGPGSMAFSLWLATKKYNNWLVQEEASLTQNVKKNQKIWGSILLKPTNKRYYFPKTGASTFALSWTYRCGTTTLCCLCYTAYLVRIVRDHALDPVARQVPFNHGQSKPLQ